MSDVPTRRASLEVLRAEATEERDVLIQERLRGGEDPWDFMEELPSVDALVVFLLRAEGLARSGYTGHSGESVDFDVLRRIALDYPPLTSIVWELLGPGSRAHRWTLHADDARP